MDGEQIVNVTTRERWGRTIQFGQDFLLERDKPDYYKALPLDVVLGPSEKPRRRCYKNGYNSYMVKYATMPKCSRIDMAPSNTYKKEATRIPRTISGTSCKHKYWTSESDERLLRESDRTLMRHHYSNPEYDDCLRLEVSGLGFVNCPHRLPSNILYSQRFG